MLVPGLCSGATEQQTRRADLFASPPATRRALTPRFRARLIQELSGFGFASTEALLGQELRKLPAVVKPALLACELKKFQSLGMLYLSRLATHSALDPSFFPGVGKVLRDTAQAAVLLAPAFLAGFSVVA